VGQKIGMAIYRSFKLTAEDVGVPNTNIIGEDLSLVYGAEKRVNACTGEIVGVSSDKGAFEHNINAFNGCSGAVIFLIDRGQEG